MTSAVPQIHAIIPAAGLSRRMGEPKLLLKIDNVTLIEYLIRQLQIACVSSISVLVREDDDQLQSEVRRCGAEVVIPEESPREMRESVEALLSHIKARLNQSQHAGWLLIPADHPIVLISVLKTLIQRFRVDPQSISVPVYQKRRGHPTIFPAHAAVAVKAIPLGYGLNWLLKSKNYQINEIKLDEPSVLWDVDTPEDFERIRRLLRN